MSNARADAMSTPETPELIRKLGLVIGLVAGVLVYALLGSQLEHAPRAAAAIGILMAIWWMTEALPLPVTALLPVALFPLLGVTDAKAATAPYASDIIFLFGGGLILGLAMQRVGLHRRIALLTILAVGTKPKRLIGGFMLATALLSMWVSNTATAVLMLPIGASVVALVTRHLRDPSHQNAGAPVSDAQARNFAVCLMLAIAFGASIGGIGTLIGTPPNLVFAGYVKNTYGQEISFIEWMRLGVPLVAVYLPLSWLLLVNVVFPIKIKEIPGGREMIRQQLRSLGPASSAEWVVFIVFMLAVFSWVTRGWIVSATGWSTLVDSVIAMSAALVLFLIPVGKSTDAEGKPLRGFVMDWETASRLPWGVLLLFGGGLSLGTAMSSTGLDAWIGGLFGGLAGYPTWITITVIVIAVVLLSELASNTAVAIAMMPVLGAAAVGMGVHPFLLLLPATLGSSCGFMLPVATPPNTVVFSSGHVSIRQMVKAGFVLDVVGTILVILTVLFFAEPLLGIDLSVVPEWATPTPTP